MDYFRDESVLIRQAKACRIFLPICEMLTIGKQTVNSVGSALT